MKNKLQKLGTTAAIWALSIGPVMAVGIDPSSKAQNYGDLGEVIGTVVNWATVIGLIAVLFYLIVAGFKYVTSSGDPGKTEEAQKQIINAIIGLAVIALAWTIVQTLSALFGFTDFQLEELSRGTG